MNPIDWAVLGVIGVSVLLGILRGLMREVISLAGWIAGLWLAFHYSGALGKAMPFGADWPLLRSAAMAILIVVGCVFAAALAGWIVRKLISAAKLSSADRSLGGLFGLARALLIAGALVFVLRDTAFAREPLWRQSLLLPYLEGALAFALRQMPDAGGRGQRA